MAELLDELSGEFGPGRIARPYRDIRFRADKSPYKTEIYATLDRGGYVRFGADGLTAALGYYMMTTAQLERYRQAVDRRRRTAPGWPSWWSGCGAKACRSVAGRCSRPRRAGIPGDHPRIGLLRCKGLICWRQWPVAPWLYTAGGQGSRGGLPAHRGAAAPLAGPAGRTGPRLTTGPAGAFGSCAQRCAAHAGAAPDGGSACVPHSASATTRIFGNGPVPVLEYPKCAALAGVAVASSSTSPSDISRRPPIHARAWTASRTAPPPARTARAAAQRQAAGGPGPAPRRSAPPSPSCRSPARTGNAPACARPSYGSA